MEWKLAEAKNKFSELVNLALHEGPQRIMRRDDCVIVLSEDEYDRITGKIPSFKSLLMNGPGFEGLDLSRSKSEMRDVEF